MIPVCLQISGNALGRSQNALTNYGTKNIDYQDTQDKNCKSCLSCESMFNSSQAGSLRHGGKRDASAVPRY